MNYAVIKTGGKQYRVAAGDTLKIEKLKGDFKKGDQLTFDQVLMTDDGAATVVGTPFIPGAAVKATFEWADRAKKITVIKYKQKSRYFKKNGHRQPYFVVKIDSIDQVK